MVFDHLSFFLDIFFLFLRKKIKTVEYLALKHSTHQNNVQDYGSTVWLSSILELTTNAYFTKHLHAFERVMCKHS